MLEAKTLIKASVEAGRELFRPPSAVTEADRVPRNASDCDRPAQSAGPSTPAMVPIRALGHRHRQHILRHLLSLQAHDRYLRFGYAASDEHVQRYVEGLDFSRDEVFGVYNRRLELIALGHLALEPGPTGLPEPIGQPAAAAANLAQAVESASQTLGQPPALRQDGEGVADRVAGTEIGEAAQAERRAAGICAELGMSVRSEDRGVGLGKRLFERAAMLARNHGVRMLFIQALSENDAMLAIARQAGARVEAIGSESEAYLLLEAPDLDSRLTEVVEEQVAEADYLMKAQAKQFWDLLAQVMAVRKALFHWPGG